ncbi:hypothetical protein GE21DRAFT_5861 [Neurospora crassa]|uniref:Uncharacterized protein n=1 Tax=Neurospora crassa (strain ATCC 24698 / 74-OR23-1A / CBS 708.71 / DSM 1257 / FGSC 987) TaxID=367110 RepID=Q7S9G0_NEUCR|nr:hypothetical protein NCU06387 [Neurospora crassa OR74A]EAA32989.1 hypothetical protein NCU06387 [Neurospora crassa OR74A]KHE85573.1 hypothetical protein GE21DRAFT_5861 [Neurospora crassa]|eukprot:XP_962225.1 hypothetical protein NCU06387 [Neurospora crassa OR74A]
MSVFSLIKRSRQAAKEQNAKNAQKDKEEAKVPYKHIPRHAALDALMGGPTGWKEADRLRIMEENRRRSIMTANGMGMPSGLSTPVHAGVFTRANSSLTHVSYNNPSGYATPVPPIPRAYSYHGSVPGWSHHGGEVSYLSIDMAGAASSGTSIKGKEKELRRPRLESGRASWSSSRLAATGGRIHFEGGSGSAPRTRDGSSSPVQSSSNSSSSEDDLEITPVKKFTSAVTTSSPLAGVPSRPTSDADSVHRLHPGHARKVSNSSYKQAGQSSSPSQSSPQSSPTKLGGGLTSSSASLSAAGIPPVPAIPPMQFGGTLALPTAPPSHKSSHPIAPSVVVEEDGPDLSEDNSLQISAGTGAVTLPIGTAVSTVHTANTTAVPAELEPMQSNVVFNISDNSKTPYRTYSSQKERSAVAVSALPTSFDEASLAIPQQLVALPQHQTTGKLGKRPKKISKEEGEERGTKVPKKSRWSFMSNRRTAVAV